MNSSTMADSAAAPASQLGPESRTSSSSSLPSLLAAQFPRCASSGSIADSDGRPDPSPSALQPPRPTPMAIGNGSEMTAAGGGGSSSAAETPTSRPLRPSPFQSFRSLRTSGPFNPLLGKGQLHVIAAISLAHICSTATSVAEAFTTSQHRRLEDEDGDWTGEWDGEWQATANDDINYQCSGDDCIDDDVARKTAGGMWLDSGDDEGGFTPEQIITYVSVGILSFMTLLCCVCYPEILVVGCGKLCGCCGVGGGAGDAKAPAVDDEDGGGDYVGGKQEEKKKKRRKSKTRDRSSSRTRSSRDVELV